MAFSEKRPLEREADVLRVALEALRAYLPPTWSLETTVSDRGQGELRLRAPDGASLTARLDTRRLINTRDVSQLIERLRDLAPASPTELPVLVSRYLAPATRERIIASGGGYIDATGHLYLRGERPAMLLRDRGADRDPWRGPGRPRGSLKGMPAARIVRALIDFVPPYSVPDLAERARTSIGAAYRVVEFLDELQMVAREARGPITAVQWRTLLERWSSDYGFAQSNTVATFLEPRGLTVLKDRLREQTDLEYAITGSLAAESIAPYAPPRLAMIHVRDIAEAAKVLGLREATTGANVALAVADDRVAFERTRQADGLTWAAPSQVAVDLMTGPGRNPNEAVMLLDWMERNESAWRH